MDATLCVNAALVRPALAKITAKARERPMDIQAKTLKGMGELADLDFNALWTPPTPPTSVSPAETKGAQTLQALQLGMKG